MQNPSDQFLARSRTYTFLSQLYLVGPIPELYSHINAVPELAHTLVAQGDDPISLQTVDQETLAADHYHIFGLNVLPFESSFFEPNFVLGGTVTESVLADYQKAGFHPDTKSENADHIGWELRFLGALCKEQAAAEEARKGGAADQIAAEQVEFIEAHLLRWLPGLVMAVHQLKMPFYSSLADLTLDIVIDHYQELAKRSSSLHSSKILDFGLPDLPDILAEEKTGLKDIARFLITPAYSGTYLSREIIERTAKDQNLPRGFGDRATMLTNLFRNAAEYDQLPSVLDDLTQIFDQWMSFYQRLPERGQDINLLTPFATPWQARTQNSQKILDQLYSSASNYQ